MGTALRQIVAGKRFQRRINFATTGQGPAPKGYSWITLGMMGGPMPRLGRNEPANLLLRKGEACLVDTGDGAITEMVNAGGDYPDLRTISISHIHFDHLGGLFTVQGLRLQSRAVGPLTIYGPPGMKAVVTGLIAAMRPSARSGFGIPGEVPIDPAANISVVELDDRAVLTRHDVKWRPLLLDHRLT